MTREAFEKWFEKYHKGTYVPVIKRTDKDGYVKETKMTGRFVNYYNIKSVKEKGATPQAPREYEETIIPHVLKVNHHTNNTLLQVYTTNHHKAHTRYYYKGVEIDEDTYYMGIGEKKKTYPQSVLFSMKLNEIYSVGGIQ